MTLYAITPLGAARRVGWRAIRAGWPLAAGETFTIEAAAIDEALVLAKDGASLRPAQGGDPPPPAEPSVDVRLRMLEAALIAAGRITAAQIDGAEPRVRPVP